MYRPMITERRVDFGFFETSNLYAVRFPPGGLYTTENDILSSTNFRRDSHREGWVSVDYWR